MPTIDIDGKQCAYGTGGKSWEDGLPTVALVHGAGGNHTVWMLQSRALAHAGWNVLAVDLPGHGNSDDDPGIASVQGFVAWLHALLQPLGITRISLVGHSLGACIAVTYAATYADRVDNLALLGSALKIPVNPQLLHNCLVEKQKAIDFILGYGHDRKYRIGGAPVPGNWVLGATDALLKRCPEEILHRDFDVCNNWDGVPLAAKVSANTLVISGMRDRMTPADMGQQMAASISGAEYELLAGVGHMLPVEAPRPVMKRIREFLNTHRGAA